MFRSVNRHGLKALLITFAFTVSHPCQSIGDTLHTTTTLLSQKIRTMPEGKRERVAVLKVGPFTLKRSSMLDVRFQIGVSTESVLPVMVGREVRLCDRPGEACGHIVIPALATNVDRSQHHAILTGALLFDNTVILDNAYLTLYLWANRSTETDTVVIEPNGALLQVQVSH